MLAREKQRKDKLEEERIERNRAAYLRESKPIFIGLMVMTKEIIGVFIQRNIRVDIRRKNTNITRNKDGT